LLGIQLYFIYDPLEDYLTPPLQGYRLQGNEYEKLTPDQAGAYSIPELGFKLKVKHNHLRLIDLKTGHPLLTPAENYEELRTTKQRLNQLEEEKEKKKIKNEMERLKK